MGHNRILLAGISLLALAGMNLSLMADDSATQPAAAPATQPSGLYSSQRLQSYPPPAATYVRTAAPASAESTFSRGRFDLTLGGQGFTAHGSSGDDSIGFVTFDADYFLLDNLSVGVELGVSPEATSRHHHHDDDRDDGLRAEEEMALLRWHFLNVGGLGLYADGGIGGLHARPDFPTGGRQDNFLAAVGGGLSLRLSQNWLLAGGARAAWLSGGDFDSRHDHHHWSDGVQYYGGVTFIFP